MDEITKSDYMNGKDLQGRNEKLMPCPFCGSTNVELKNTHSAFYWIECQNCESTACGDVFKSSLRSDYEKAAESAIEKWNTRK